MTKNIYNATILLLISISTFAQSPHAAKLYGMTQYGGTDHKGTIFHYTPEIHTINVDYEFKIKVKGATPKSDIVTANNGKYYGTTTAGGAYNAGVIFEWDSISGIYSELYNFTGTEGSDARGAMVLYNGKFYGMTNSGGANNFGVIYEWDYATNTYTDKIDMDSINGKNPDGSLTLIGSKFYGFTYNGGLYNNGVLFEWDPATNIYTKKYDFNVTNGSNPVGKLVDRLGKFYAMTNKGGVNDKGVIYEWNYTTNVYTKKYDFDGTTGAYPLGYLTWYSGRFYGLTYEGGNFETSSSSDHYGVLFQWTPTTNTFVKKRNLGALIFGQQSTHGPLGSLTLKGDELWGITSEGYGGTGGIFSWKPLTSVWTDYFFNHYISPPYNYVQNEDYFQAPGNNSYGAFLLSGNKLLATSSSAGGGGVGCIFEYVVDSNRISRSVHMKASDGAYPKGSLTRLGDDKLFGMTFLGGENHLGNIFEWDIKTNQFTERFQFDGYTTGAAPWGNLNYYNGKFYGFGLYGRSKNYPYWASWGTRKDGNIFSWDPLTNDYQIKLESPMVGNRRSPFDIHEGKFYTTGNGGVHGSILEYDPDTNTATDTALFDGINGDFHMYQDYYSANGMVFYNGKYYGMTPGPNFKGGIYEWDPVTNVITGKIVFADSMGIVPTGDLTLVGDVFYGLTSGMPANYGSLFKWDPTTNIFEKKSDLGNCNGNYILNPKGTLTYSGGKLYGSGYGYELHNSAANGVTFPGVVFEYDPVLDSITDTKTFTYTGGESNSGVNPAFTKLLEVIPNEVPVLMDVPALQTVCSGQNNTATFIISDADDDTLHFSISSSDTVLIPLSTISISNTDSIYTIRYLGAYNLSGIDTISIAAKDGYGGSLNFSFAVIVNALPDTTIIKSVHTLTAQQDGATYQWINCSTNTAITGAIEQSYTATVSGNYAVSITTGSCTDTSGCYKISTIGIEEHPADQVICSAQNNSTTFTLSNAGSEPVHFIISCGDTTLIPLSSISISSEDSIYTIHYAGVYNLSGIDTIFIIANDSYGGSVNFSFVVTVNALPDTTVIKNIHTLTAQQEGATYQWMDCSTNTFIPGETAQSYTATVTGNYSVIVTTGTCSDTSACIAVEVSSTGIDENLSIHNISVQPNPAHDEIRIGITKNTEGKIRSVKIKNVFGENLIEQNQISMPINISMLTNGIYFINLETSNGMYTTTFIKH